MSTSIVVMKPKAKSHRVEQQEYGLVYVIDVSGSLNRITHTFQSLICVAVAYGCVNMCDY